MQRNSVKRLPVLDEYGELLGIITASDLLAMLGVEFNRLSSRPNVSPWKTPKASFDYINQ